jgi:phytoene dehydrogenase-like protein
VLLDGGRACGVRLSNGDLIRAKRVVSAVGYRATEAVLAASDNPPVPPPMPLKTKQSAGFVMANIALNGTARDLGIDDSTLWLQPADEANGFDALAGERAFFADPLGVPLTQIPAGITFPSVKGRDGYVPDKDVPQSECVHHSCQILVPAEWKWFEEYVPAKGDDDESSRHAPPHVARRKQEEYDRIKERWSVRLLALFHQHYPKTIGRVEFCVVWTPATLAYYLRAVHGAGVGLDVTPGRFVDPEELREVDPRHPRVEGLWRAGQDHLMCGQVMAAASGIITALRMRGTWDTTKFGVRTLRLLLESSDGDASISRSTKEKRS